MSTNKDIIYKKIVDELVYLGYNLSLVGTRYLSETIYIIHNNSLIDNINLKKQIYPILAKKYNKETNNIKCCINYSTEVMYENCNYERISEYFKFKDRTKPSAKFVIYAVLNKI